MEDGNNAAAEAGSVISMIIILPPLPCVSVFVNFGQFVGSGGGSYFRKSRLMLASVHCSDLVA